jgi:hypothetical protein
MAATRRDDPVWNDDSVEVFLRADPAESYCQFIANPRGTLYDARNREAGWNSSAQVKASIQAGASWTVTLEIPMRELGAYAGDDQVWRANINRTRPERTGDPLLQYSWSVMTSPDYHAAGEFGIVTGVEVPERADGVSRVRATPAPRPVIPNRGTEVGGVTVYYRTDFDKDPGGWSGANGAELALTEASVSGGALRVACRGRWSAAHLPVGVIGSRGLKIALHMKAQEIPAVGINVFDTVAADNTTAYGYRYLTGDAWVPVLYYLDRFRYNARTTGSVSRHTAYANVRFWGPDSPAAGAAFTIDSFVMYRGEDRRPPEKVAGLEARATGDGVALSWSSARDNVGSQVYVIARAHGDEPFAKIAESVTPSYLDVPPRAGTLRYRVFAADFEENFGPWSASVSVSYRGPTSVPELSREEADRIRYAGHVRRMHARGAGKVRRGHATLFGDSLTGATVYPQCAQAAFRTLTVNAFGFPAMRTSFGRAKVGEILARDNPEFMCILYGTNNNKSASHLAPAMEDLAAIVAACEDHGTVPILGTIPPRGWTPESAPEATFNRHVVALCRRLAIPTGYIFEDFQAAGDRRRHMGSDGVHWRGSGMEIAARAWGKALDQIRFVLRDRP